MAETDSIRTCARCAGPIHSRLNKDGTHRKQKYCSRKCNVRAEAVRNPRPKRQRGSRPRKPVLMYCFGCCQMTSRVVRSGKDAKRYCSQSCYTQAKVRINGEIAALARMADREKAREQAIRDAVVLPEVEALRRIARYVEKPRINRRPCCKCAEPTIGKRMASSRLCPTCKVEAKREAKRKRSQTPSGRASKKKYKTLRRTRLAIVAESIDPIAVFERDGWKCQLCGVKTPRSLRGTNEPRAPELDHVLPLALGGGHTWANVQCACRQCNNRKGATPMGQFNLPMAA